MPVPAMLADPDLRPHKMKKKTCVACNISSCWRLHQPVMLPHSTSTQLSKLYLAPSLSPCTMARAAPCSPCVFHTPCRSPLCWLDCMKAVDLPCQRW